MTQEQLNKAIILNYKINKLKNVRILFTDPHFIKLTGYQCAEEGTLKPLLLEVDASLDYDPEVNITIVSYIDKKIESLRLELEKL